MFSPEPVIVLPFAAPRPTAANAPDEAEDVEQSLARHRRSRPAELVARGRQRKGIHFQTRFVSVIPRRASAPDTEQSSGPSAADSVELAKQLQNPVADLINVPLQRNVELGGGADGSRRRWNG
jgi:hypothetical protein